VTAKEAQGGLRHCTDRHRIHRRLAKCMKRGGTEFNAPNFPSFMRVYYLNPDKNSTERTNSTEPDYRKMDFQATHYKKEFELQPTSQMTIDNDPQSCEKMFPKRSFPPIPH